MFDLYNNSILDNVLILGKICTYTNNILYLLLLIVFIPSESIAIARAYSKVILIKNVLILYKAG